jgi:benzil reductase ((S)-benzoin forming)
VDQWVRTVGAEQDRAGGRCRVVAVAPGVVETPMQEEIRKTSETAFPDLPRFVELYEGDELRDADVVAVELLALLERDLANGTVLDLRDEKG